MSTKTILINFCKKKKLRVTSLFLLQDTILFNNIIRCPIDNQIEYTNIRLVFDLQGNYASEMVNIYKQEPPFGVNISTNKLPSTLSVPKRYSLVRANLGKMVSFKRQMIFKGNMIILCIFFLWRLLCILHQCFITQVLSFKRSQPSC